MKIATENYQQQLDQARDYCVEHITRICDEIGPRESGSPEERKAQQYWADEMSKFADSVEIEDFDVHPHAFMSWVVIDATLVILGLIFSFLKMPYVTLGLAVAAIVCMMFEFLFYRQFIDKLFKKKVSCNVIGTRKPTGEVKRRIIFSGHCDSSWEWFFTYKGGAGFLKFMLIPAIIGLFFVTGVALVSVIVMIKGIDAPAFLTYLQWGQLVFVPFFVALYWFLNWKQIVHGANDNLTGCAASVAVLKYLSDNDIRFEHTEVVAMTAGCEEAGLRGSHAYTKRHKKELTEVETVFFGMDTLTDLDDMAIYIRDMTFTVKNDERVCALMKAGSTRAGVDLPYRMVFLGASDAAAVSKLGIPAATLAAMDPAPARYYHTRLDAPDKLQPNVIRIGVDTCLQSLEIFDEQGLRLNYEV